ncbi:tldc domain-containing protein [Stylonychia lemnae]|uniref:Tldc domain-containing protein n=1 Tax=Stylonychia lemnae TaxID=5949 RepID=A0A078B2S8_STYLE|nr:tldc domain-containing protein [Stylonychia lemnae]|eukprot:CDW87813.1 tldc domain-containing protein [Stylonychia lemnae]
MATKGLGLNIREITDRYRLDQKIGKGSFGEVYQAQLLDDKQQVILNKSVALKQQNLYKFVENANAKVKDKFTLEILRLIREIATFELRHPNIVEIEDAFLTSENKFVITSELAETNLETFVQRKLNYEKKPYNVSEISFIMLQLLEGLGYIHDSGFIHRDIAPDNILVFKDGIIKICDLGIASFGKHTTLDAGKDTHKAPEIKLGRQYDNKVDIWSLGIVLHYLMTGSDKDKKGNFINSILSDPEGPEQKIVLPDQYSQFQQIFNRMTTFKANLRPTIEELKGEFLKLVQDKQQYYRYQNYVMNYYYTQTKQIVETQMQLFKKNADYHLKNNQIKNSEATQNNLTDLVKDLKSYDEMIKSYINNKTEVKLQKKVATLQVQYEEKKRNDQVKNEPEVKSLTAQQISQCELEYRRLVDKHVKQQGNANELVFKLNGQCKLLYKATRDGFKAADFHSKCDNQSPTVSFILSEFGLIFGGYTSIPWTAPENLYQNNSDGEAFIFSLSKNTVHNQHQNTGYAVSHFKNQMMQFGMSEIQIKDDCNEKRTNSSKIGSTYQTSNGIEFGSQKSEDYLAGAKKFKVLEVEVYSVAV